jgi:hypothetical protein
MQRSAENPDAPDPLLAAAAAAANPNRRIAMGKIFGTAAHDAYTFHKWAKEVGLFLHPSVSVLVPVPGMGVGIVAQHAIEKGATIVMCPQHVAMSPNDALAGPGAHRASPAVALLQTHLRRAAFPAVADSTRTTLRLMSEVCRRHSSPWAPWVAALPIMEPALWELPADAAAAFAGSDCGQVIQDHPLHDQWELVKPFVEGPGAAAFPAPLNTKQVFLHCAAQVLSRNFHIEHRDEEGGGQGPFLVPGVDLINHGAPGTANVTFRLHGGNRKELTFCVVSLRDIKAGEQILYDYGDLPSARFIVEFQFNPSRPVDAKGRPSQLQPTAHDTVRFSQPALAALCAAAAGLDPADTARRVKALDSWNLIFREGAFLQWRSPAAAAGAVAVEREATAGAAAPTAAASSSSVSVTDGMSAEAKADALAEAAAAAAETDVELWNAIALLTLPSKDFDGANGQRWWRCDRGDTRVRAMVRRVLELRRDASVRAAGALRGLLTAAPAEEEAVLPPHHRTEAVLALLALAADRSMDEAARLDEEIARV